MRQPRRSTRRRQKRLQLSPAQVSASVLAALTGALAASYLGVAGTIIGAAVMSLASTVGTAVYRYFLSRTADRLRSAAVSRNPQPHPPGLAFLAGLHEAGPDSPPGHPGVRRRWAELTAAIALTFALAMTVITGIELAAGKPLDAIIWHRHESGTSIRHVARRGAGSPRTPHPRPHAPAPGSTGTSRSVSPAHSSGPAATGKASPVPTTTAATPSPPRPSSPHPSPDPTAPSPTAG